MLAVVWGVCFWRNWWICSHRYTAMGSPSHLISWNEYNVDEGERLQRLQWMWNCFLVLYPDKKRGLRVNMVAHGIMNENRDKLPRAISFLGQINKTTWMRIMLYTASFTRGSTDKQNTKVRNLPGVFCRTSLYGRMAGVVCNRIGDLKWWQDISQEYFLGKDKKYFYKN